MRVFSHLSPLLVFTEERLVCSFDKSSLRAPFNVQNSKNELISLPLDGEHYILLCIVGEGDDTESNINLVSG